MKPPVKKKRRPTAKKQAKRRVVAKGLVIGASTSKIARAAGTSERNVQRIAAEPETQFLVTRAFKDHLPRLVKLAGKAVDVIESGLKAKKKTTIDHFTRLRSIERLADVMDLAQGKVKEVPVQTGELPSILWEDFLVLYRSGRTTTDGKHDTRAGLPRDQQGCG